MLFTVLLLVIIILAVCVYKNKDRNYWKDRNVVQVNELLKKFIFGNRSLPEIYKEIYDDHPGEPVVGTFLGVKPTLMLRDTQNIQAVFANDFESFYSRGFVTNKSDILSDNVLFTRDYPRWKILRKNLTPVFTSAKLKNMCYITEKTAYDFVEMVKENNKIRAAPFEALYTYTTASIGAAVFGIDTQLKSTMDSPFLKMSWQAIEPTLRANLRFFVSNLSPTLFKFLNLKLFGDQEDFFLGVVRAVLDTRRRDKKTVHDFIESCLELQKLGLMKDPSTGYELEFTDEVVAAQAFFFFIAGADSSANTMHFTLLELSSNPHILERLHQEIDKMFAESNDQLVYDAIGKLQYLDMVVNEAMRKYPPISVLQRECTKDTVLPVGNLKIKKGIMTVIPVFAIHRDEKYFPKPDLFDPERFAPGNFARIPKFSYLPFGEGKRICLGIRFARLQVKAGLAFLLRNFTLRPQQYNPKRFEKSFFSLRDTEAKYELVQRKFS